MKRLLWIFTMILCVFLSGCYGLSQNLELKICGAYAVPGMLHFDLKGTETSCLLIEKDSEGRILFEWSGCNMISGENTSYLVICQAIEPEYVYFYEDICYIEKTEQCETLQNFKDMNDWGKPMDWERASFRPKKASFDLYMIPSRTLSSDAVASAFFAETGTKLKDVGNSFLLDINPSGQELHCVKTDSFGAEKAILFIVSENMECTFVTTTCLEIDRTAIENLKKQAKWQHGNN